MEIQGAAHDIAVSQARIASGLAIAGPKDGGAEFQIATGLRSDLVDADLSKEAAELTAQQVHLDLGAQSLRANPV